MKSQSIYYLKKKWIVVNVCNTQGLFRGVNYDFQTTHDRVLYYWFITYLTHLAGSYSVFGLPSQMC